MHYCIMKTALCHIDGGEQRLTLILARERAFKGDGVSDALVTSTTTGYNVRDMV